ncbi:MAG TPA: hypothetical protein VG408_00055, partial [Actinomycetota bacterium]|nr:hypothetical protein [Actinomycetota bacterium]
MRRRIEVLSLALAVIAPSALFSSEAATAAGLTSGPIEYVKTIPIDSGAAQVAKRVDDYLYVTSWKALSIYDVTDLLNPVHITTIPTGFQFPAERMDTNGKILIIAEQTPLIAIDSPLNRMHVFDVSDPADPSEIAILEGTTDHTFTCVLKCRWAYG